MILFFSFSFLFKNFFILATSRVMSGVAQVALVVKNLPAEAGDIGDVGSIPGWEDPPSLATHCSILAWRIPRTQEPGRLQSMVEPSRVQLKRLGTHVSCGILIPQPGLNLGLMVVSHCLIFGSPAHP